MAKVKYKVSSGDNISRFEKPKGTINKKRMAEEEKLKELLSTLPTLKKHGMAGEIESKVKQLRDGRKGRAFTLKLKRDCFFTETRIAADGSEKIVVHKELVAEAPVMKAEDKYAVMRALKEQLIKQLREKRKASFPKLESKHFDHGFSVPYLDFTYVEKESVLKAMFKKIRHNMKNNKNPTDAKAKYVGVEIELAAQEDRETLSDAIFAAGIGKHVCVKGDGSIGDGSRDNLPSKLLQTYPHAHEICVLAKESEIEDVINKLCNVLNKVLHTAVDKTCGLHVHLDMRNRDPKTCFHNLVLSQQWLYAMLPAQRRNSRYSIPIKGPEWRDRPESRYYGVNAEAYVKYKTLELRMHCGTTNAAKINGWIKLGMAICEAPKFKTAPTTVAAFSEAANLTPAVVDYMKSRIVKFADQHKKNIPKEEPGTMPEIEKIDAVADGNEQEESEVA